MLTSSSHSDEFSHTEIGTVSTNGAARLLASGQGRLSANVHIRLVN